MPKMTDDELRAHIERVVDAMPEPSLEQCRRVAVILHVSGALR